MDKNRIYEDLKHVCMFIGNPRSGHSLVGSIIDAHKNACIGHEINLLKLIKSGCTDEEDIYQHIIDHQAESLSRRKKWTGYSYEIENTHQGRFSQLKVIGDKKGGSTTIQIRNEPTLTDRLNNIFGSKLRFIHVIRDPFDNIIARNFWQNKHEEVPMAQSVERYFSNIEEVARIENESLLSR